MRIVLPIVYFRRSIAAQKKFAQKVKECLMARTLDLIRGYMFSHRMEPRAVDVRSSHQFEDEIGAASSENGLFIGLITRNQVDGV
jgi:hypothetical protein